MKLLSIHLHPFGGVDDRRMAFQAGLNVLEVRRVLKPGGWALFTEPVIQMERYPDELRRYLPIDPILADAMAGRLRGVPVPRPGSVHGSNDYHGVPGDSATLVLDIVPQSPAQVGQTVSIHSFGLPCPANGDQIRIRLANIELQILESTPDHATARLPNYPVTGVLEAIRVSEVWTLLIAAPIDPVVSIRK